MTVFFAMIGEGEDRQPAFYLTRKAAPEGAIAISDARHAQLLKAQAEGRAIVADASGRPVVARRNPPDAGAIRAKLFAAIRREARDRIRAISPEWRQMNDLREPTAAGAERFARIDAIRAASDTIEGLASGLSGGALASFPVANHPIWPEFD